MAIAESGLSTGCLPSGYYLKQADTLSMSAPRRENERKWNEIYEEIQRWMDNPASLANEDGEFPAKEIIGLAARLAQQIADRAIIAPIAVVPDGNGGITFEWQDGRFSRWIEISTVGDVEMIVMRDGEILLRQSME